MEWATIEEDLSRALNSKTVLVLGFATRRAGSGVVLWNRQAGPAYPSDSPIIEWGTHRVEALPDGSLDFHGGEYFPALASEHEAVAKALDAARRSFAERAGLIPQEVE